MPPSGPDTPPEPTAGGPVELPVARILVDRPQPHLDRPFDYRVTAEQDALAVPGARVRVRFAGRLVSGFVLERVAGTDHSGPLTSLDQVVSPEPVLPPRLATTCRAVADHYAGTMADVVRLAVPPRHARTEAEAPLQPASLPPAPEPGDWAAYPDGVALLAALATGGRPRAVVGVGPGHDWPSLLARAALATASGGRGVVVIVPDQRDVARVDAALTPLAGPGTHVVLHAELGPARRSRAYLAALRGSRPVVVGTRSAVFAPVRDLGALVVWDDGDDLLAEPRAPYPHARDVALLRAHLEGAALVLAGWARTAEAERLVQSGWARPLAVAREVVRRTAPLVRTGGADPVEGRLPRLAFRVARAGLQDGPVLVQVPRRGYWPALACRRCWAPARCSVCAGPLTRSGPAPVGCGWCGAQAEHWRCPRCGEAALRASVVGSERTAEELGRAFPGVPLRQSGLGHRLDTVPAVPALVVATPGAEPVADGGYAAALLLDGAALLHRPDLRAGEETLRRWLGAGALVRPGAAGAGVVVVAPPGHRAVQALLRWDPAWFAAGELAERESARLPPAARVAELTGAPADVADLLARADLPGSADVLGPVESGERARALVRTSLGEGLALTRALRSAAGMRSLHRSTGAVRIRVDPVDLG